MYKLVCIKIYDNSADADSSRTSGVDSIVYYIELFDSVGADIRHID